MKASKTENRFETGFKQSKTGLQKTVINIPKTVGSVMLENVRMSVCAKIVYMSVSACIYVF